VVVNPFDAKGRIVEDHVDSFHVAVNPDGNNSKLRCFSRVEYEAARNEAEGNNGAPSVASQATEPTPTHAQAG
jgi:uncharacterized protein YPO0396